MYTDLMRWKKDHQSSERSLSRAAGDLTHSLAGLSGKDSASRNLYEEARELRDQVSKLLGKVKDHHSS